MSESIFLMFNCPEEGISMSIHIEHQFSGTELRAQCKDEEGCGRVTVGKHRTRLQDIGSTEFLIFTLNRIITVDGHLKIVDNKVPVGGNIHLEDVSGISAMFFLIAVIHRTGPLLVNTTNGHYQADVRNSIGDSWMRTSDERKDQRISHDRLTDQGYIFLYRKAIGTKEWTSLHHEHQAFAIQENERRSALHFIALQKWDDVGQNSLLCKKLLLHGVDVKGRVRRSAALYHAVQYGHSEVCQALLLHGADVQSTDSLGSTALHYAAIYDRTELCKKRLLQFNIKTNLTKNE
jgi:hypothetical protein